ncbi:histone deacetylase complex subunit SAP30L-like [Watersipora subatra]|uniref:histone deacetylase complex subunit SAP30L-like n=1 Tax=Watersipora subatra TaxID=2589382 RepID=UPI00355C12D0
MVLEESAADVEGATTEQLCCLVENSKPCMFKAGNASYGKKIQRTVQQRKLKLEINEKINHTYICDRHKEMIHSLRQIKPRKRPGSDRDSSPEVESKRRPDVNFLQMPVNTLRRYKRHYKLQTKPGLNKNQLSEAVYRHFKSISVNEKEVLNYFMYMVKHKRSKLDNDADSPMSSPKPMKYQD